MSSRGLQKLFSHIVKITSQHLIITNNLTVRLPSLCLPTSTNVSPPGFSLWPCINWKYRFFSRLKSTVPIQFPDHAFWIPLVACPVVSFSFCCVPCLFCLSVLPLSILPSRRSHLQRKWKNSVTCTLASTPGFLLLPSNESHSLAWFRPTKRYQIPTWARRKNRE